MWANAQRDGRPAEHMSVYQYGGCPPSLVCCARVWTTHKEHLVVFIVVQSFVGIGEVVSIICTILYFAQKLAFWSI